MTHATHNYGTYRGSKMSKENKKQKTLVDRDREEIKMLKL